jgi:hypothetical protein
MMPKPKLLESHAIALAMLSLTLCAAPALAQDEAPPAEEPVPTADPAPAAEAPAAEEALAEAQKEEEKKKEWYDRIHLKADLRYRIEMIKDGDTELRYRHRIRARAGVFADVLDSLSAGVQLGTGGADDPVSNNQSMTEAFSSKPIWLDLAYFHWHPSGWIDDVNLWGGKMHNPYVRVGKSELLFDPDLNPEGLALNLGHRFSVVEPFVTTGAFFVEERKEDKDSWLYGTQAGLKLHFLEGKLYFLAGGGYFNYTRLQGNTVLWDETDSFGNSATPDDPAVEDSPLSYDHDYDIVEGYAEIGGKIVKVPWAAFGSVARNIAVERDNLGWLAGALVGQTKETLDLYFRYIYKAVPADMTVGLFTDSDFLGGGTDGTGHEFNLGFVIYKPASLGVTYFYNQKPYDGGGDYHRAQIDFKLKF